MDGKDARVVDYFYVIAGTSTSTGGILATMITAPNEKNLPFVLPKILYPFTLSMAQGFSHLGT